VKNLSYHCRSRPHLKGRRRPSDGRSRCGRRAPWRCRSERSLLVGAHQPRIGHHVGRKDWAKRRRTGISPLTEPIAHQKETQRLLITNGVAGVGTMRKRNISLGTRGSALDCAFDRVAFGELDDPPAILRQLEAARRPPDNGAASPVRGLPSRFRDRGLSRPPRPAQTRSGDRRRGSPSDAPTSHTDP